MLESWDLWFPDAGATGISFARSRVDDQAAGNRLLVHADHPNSRSSPATRTAPHRPGQRAGTWSARPDELPGPPGRHVLLEDGWPTQDDLGRLVILPGGEAGILKAWWHANDHSEWRWQIEFYNHI